VVGLGHGNRENAREFFKTARSPTNGLRETSSTHKKNDSLIFSYHEVFIPVKHNDIRSTGYYYKQISLFY